MSPPLSSNSWMYAIASIAGIMLLLVALLAYYVSLNWERWKKNALDKSFKKTDLDNSGKIDSNELYIAVLQFYLDIHFWGLNVRAPRRENVLRIMEVLDGDNSGEISRSEFQTVVEILLSQQASRIAIQVALFLLCPVVATYSCFWIKMGTSTLVYLCLVELPAAPAFIVTFMDNVPTTFYETLICSILLLSINPMLSMFDYLFEKKVSKDSVKRAVKEAQLQQLAFKEKES